MDWYYATEGTQRGPVGEDDIQDLVAQGVITQGTLVWHEGMEDWRPYGAMVSGQGADVAAGPCQCVVCQGHFAEDDVITIEGSCVCAGCKPLFLQSLREGVMLGGRLALGGIGPRIVAFFIDLVLVRIVLVGFNMLLGSLFIESADDPVGALLLLPMFSVSALVLGATYHTFFVGRWGATPGKLVCGLRIVRPDGEKVTYLRAFARYWAKILSLLLLLIGYIMALFDSERRGLHDHICDTRVVRT